MNSTVVIKRYCKEVKKALKACDCYQKSIIDNLEHLAADYFAACPDATELSFRQQFGAPESYAMEYAAATPDDLLVSKLQTKKRITRIVALGISAIILITGISIAFFLWYHYTSAYGYHLYGM